MNAKTQQKLLWISGNLYMSYTPFGIVGEG